MAHFTRPEGILTMVVSLLLLAVASHAIAVPHGDIKHHTVPAQFEAKNVTEYDLTKRYTVDHSKWTYYSTGKGACGGTNKDSDWIVALDQQKFDSGDWCWKTIKLYYNGKSAEAQIVDSCPGCGSGNLDLSPGLFSYFDSLDKGVLYGSYNT